MIKPDKYCPNVYLKRVAWFIGILFIRLALPNIVTAQEPAICPANLNAYWPLDEVNSTTFQDTVGTTTGTCAGGCPQTSTGLIQTAQVFDGQTTGINFPVSPTLAGQVGSSFSIAFWMKGIAGTTCTTKKNEVIIGRDDNTSQLHWWVGCTAKTGNAISGELSADY